MTTITEFERSTALYIYRHRLLHPGAPVIVALSGGADSVALLSVLLALGYDCRAAHCNFHLRGEESMRDMRHVQELCRQLDVDLYIRDFNVGERRRHTGESMEEACRQLRYDWFADLLDSECAQAIAVGHHREDRTETFLLNLMRGAGIKGLTSMRPRSGSVVRPLLPHSRSDIELYLAERGLSFVTDSTNADNGPRRNRLRNTIIPALEEAFPGASDAILRSIANLEAAEALYKESVDAKKALYLSDGCIDLRSLATEPQAPTLLLEMLAPLGFNYSQVCDILADTEATGSTFISADRRTAAERSRGRLLITGADASHSADAVDIDPRHEIVAPAHILISRSNVGAFAAESLGADVAYIDAAALDGNPRWQLRHWRRGDRIVPFGSSKSKLVSDIFANAKLTADQKRRIWLLTRNEEIVWIVGLRNSARWTIGPDTKEYLRLFYDKN